MIRINCCKITFLIRLNLLALLMLFSFSLSAQSLKPKFRVIGFYTGINDKAHVSFVHEANRWFAGLARKMQFSYDSTKNWENLNSEFLKNYEIVLFLDSRPDKQEQRVAFEQFMKGGGAWMGFHFAAFALTPSDFPQNWNWYHNEFLGAGEYKGNTWRPTAAILRVERPHHPASQHLPPTFKASPNEWYSWKNDLRKNPDIDILLSIDPSSFPLGTGPKAWEIWHKGDYPVVWTNRKYRMLYINMGHNDIDYEGKMNRDLSQTFTNDIQNKLVIDALKWLGKQK